ncbi:MAG: hypothetical protein LBH82_01810 [Bacteroidales bacterium]|jgi:hypothetical protein|nr:hypothetical protein [Bacteroidales bacterium]
MNIFRKCISVFLLVLFLAYSGGIGFSLHHCECCRRVSVSLFEESDCCTTSETKHHHKKQASTTQHDCCRSEKDDLSEETFFDVVPAHCEQQCCISKYQFFKINSKYVSFQYDKLVRSLENSPVVLFHLLWRETCLSVLHKTNISDSRKERPPLLPAGDSFLIFSHQLLFYA